MQLPRLRGACPDGMTRPAVYLTGRGPRYWGAT
jgi:hypothetical protein